MADNLENKNVSPTNATISKHKVTQRKINDNTSKPDKSRQKKNESGILRIIFLCLIAVALFRILLGKPIPTFTSLLDFFSGSFTVNFPIDWFVDWGDWGFLNFLRDLLMNFSSIFVFLGTGLVNLLSFFIAIIRWIFL